MELTPVLPHNTLTALARISVPTNFYHSRKLEHSKNDYLELKLEFFKWLIQLVAIY